MGRFYVDSRGFYNGFIVFLYGFIVFIMVIFNSYVKLPGGNGLIVFKKC